MLAVACTVLFIIVVAENGFAPLSVNPLFGPSGQPLYDYGGNFDAKHTGQYWRLITAAFVHAGVVHLLSNVAFIFILWKSLKIESSWGSALVFLIFIVSAIVGNLGMCQVVAR